MKINSTFFTINSHTTLFLVFLSCIILFTACQKEHLKEDKQKINAEKDTLLAIFKKKEMRNIDSVSNLLENMPKSWGLPAEIILRTELGKLYREKSEFVLAVEQHRKAIELAIVAGDTLEIIRIYNQLGTDYRRIGSQADAADAHFQALRIAEIFSGKDKKEGMTLLSYSLNGIGNVYKTLDNGQEAFQYFKRSSELDKKLSNYLGIAMNYSTMGSVLEHQNKLDSAEIYYRIALSNDSLAQSQTGIAICHNRIGQLMVKRNRLDEALQNYSIARKILTARGDVWNKMKTEVDIARIYIQQGRNEEAYNILKSLEAIGKERKMYGFLEEAYYHLGNLYSNMGQYKLASEARAMSINYGKNVQTMRNEQNVMEARIKFEREINERRIENINKQNEQEKKQSRIITLAGATILILLLGLLIVLYNLIRIQRRRNSDLEAANTTKDKFFSIVSHDLKNPVIAQRNALQAIVDNIDTFDSDSLVTGMYALLQSSESQLELLNNMLNWARVQTGRINYKPINFDLKNVVISAIKLLTPAMEEKNLEIQSSITNATIVKADRNMTEITLRNLITNAIKFSKPGGKIKIDLSTNGDNRFLLSVIDNGVGLSSEQISNLFKLNKHQSTPGTAGEKGSGLGLIVCKELVERNKGKLFITSVPDVETKFTFTIEKA